MNKKLIFEGNQIKMDQNKLLENFTAKIFPSARQMVRLLLGNVFKESMFLNLLLS